MTSPVNRTGRILLTCVLVSAAAVVATPAAHAAAPAGNGRIAFVNGGHLYVMNSDGLGVVDITPPGCNDAYEPDWTPDGSKIAYINRCGPSGSFDISTINPDGSGFAKLIATDVDDARPAYSPDGTKILYNSAAGEGGLYVANANGHNRVRLTDAPGRDDCPSWSPDGHQIAFASNRTGNYQIYVMNADGSNVRRISQSNVDDKWPAWSPDGGRIAFTRGPSDGNSNIYWMETDGSRVTQLTTNHVSEFPDWSPDATMITYTDGGQVATMMANGSEKSPLINGIQPDWESTAAQAAPSIWFSLPASGGNGQPITLSGKLTVPGASAAGKTIQVFATPPGGSRSQIGTATTGAAGYFSFETTPDSGGSWTYETVWPGDGGHPAASYSAILKITRPQPKVQLGLSKRSLEFGQSETLTVTVLTGPSHAEVSVYGQTAGTHKKKLVKHGRVNGGGVMKIRVKPNATTTYTANVKPTSAWTAASSPAKKLEVRAVWQAKSLGGYATAGRYHLFHYTTTCHSPHYVGCPWEQFNLSPGHPGEKCLFTFQYFIHGRWHTNRYTWALNSKSSLYAVTSYDSPKIIGVPHRVLAQFPGDADHAASTSDWIYWKVTN